MPAPRVLSVGQCGLDHGKISGYLRQAFAAETINAGNAAEALRQLRSGPFSLVLINRVFDRDGSPGLDLLRAIKADPDLAPTPTMLVSNYPEAQSEAVSLGALPGFGKADVGRSRADETLATVLQAAEVREPA